MSYFREHFWGEKNHGFDVLYHNMKHGQISTKELADFIRERATIEENYAKSMAKLSKMATNGTQLGTFAPLWEVFRISSDKLALCHMELMRKLHDLIKEIARYGEEQGRVHKKSKEEVSGTLEAVQHLHGVTQLLPKSKELYYSKCQEYERLRREGTSQKEIDKAELKSKKASESLRRAVEKYNAARADFEQRMLDSAVRFQEIEESHLRHMKGLIGSYSHSVEDTHVQIGQVHEEFKQNTCPEVDEEGFTVRPNVNQNNEAENHGCSSSDSDYDDDEPRKFYIHIKPVQPREAGGSAEATDEQLKATVGNLILPPSIGGTVKRQSSRHISALSTAPADVALAAAGEPTGKAKPCHPAARINSYIGKRRLDAASSTALFGPPLESAFEAEDFSASRAYVLASSPSPFSSSSPENVEDSGLDSPSHPVTGPSPDSRPWTPRPGTPQSPLSRQTSKDSPPFPDDRRAAPAAAPAEASSSSSSPSPAPASGRESVSPCPWPRPAPGIRLCDGTVPAAPEPSAHADPPRAPTQPCTAPKDVPVVAPPRRVRTKRPSAGQTLGSNSDLSRSLSPSPLWSCGPSHSAPASLGERGFFTAMQPALGLSRGPSPVVLGSQDALPVATAFTEYIHAYFKGRDPDSCLVKVTGELTMSFPAGIVRVFSGNLAPPVLSFRLLRTAPIEQFLPNAEMLYSDPSQSDPSTKDFWLNMAALTGHLQRQAEQAPAASYYNVALLKYQFSRLGPSAAPLQLSVRWDCAAAATQVCVEYAYNAGAMAAPAPLANVQVLLPVEEPVANIRLQPAASWNLEEKRLLWRLLDVPSAPDQRGCGCLSASWQPLDGPSRPSPVAAQFTSEGSTLSGVELELVGSGYRMSLVKKRFATGIYLAGS
ncbi:PREDICTED: F-BAR domain only protein 1-like [Gavialis gangeticus]|uniref:F-BAR domain only protein 1-like n=1 Tax=Gavialis gangeticus TaxID=94835 RepID=UPI00092E40BB|nr:PREDICTED: F-BAR domain only protein 1-like [Gavialis gangeticus]